MQLRRYTSTFSLFAALVLVLIGAAGCGIKLKDAPLYDGVEQVPPPPKPERIAQVVEPVIFDENAKNFWVTDDPNCTTGEATKEVFHSGETSLQINWNRDPQICEWAGFGIGWDDWSGKDLSEVYDYAAIQMYVRSQEGKMFGLPIVLTLEDYSGHRAWSYTINKYFERYYIDEEWQRVLVPLNTFDLEEDGIDISNIKQLGFELQQAGGIYLDDVELVYYEPIPEESWMEEEERPDPTAFPIQLFEDVFINSNGWGLLSDDCQAITVTKDAYTSGSQAIHAEWDADVEDCHKVEVGISWNRWFRVDLTDVKNNSVISIDIKPVSTSLEDLPLHIGFEDYQRRIGSVTPGQSEVSRIELDDGWYRLKIPIAALDSSTDLADIKQLLLQFKASGEAYIDNIHLHFAEAG